MRARQQLAPRPKPRPSELIVVDQQQSFELVRTVVSATISNIAFLRDLFPEDCFQSRFYDTADPDATYTTFMKGSKKQHSIRKQCEGLVNWKVLVRGTNPRVNKLLDWLEIGAADALKRKYLEKLQLSVFDARSPDPALLEAYIWTFSYENEVPTVQFGTQTPGEGIVFLSNAKRELRHMVHDVIREVQELPDLPEPCKVNMHLTYNDSCPDSYEPFGFHPETNPSFLSGAVERPTLTNMDTGLHKVCINVLKPDDVSQSSITEGAPRLCELSVRNSSQNARAANTGSTPPSAIESLVSANFTYQETPARGQLEETQDTQFPSSSTVEPNESGTIQTSLLSSLIIPSFSRVILNRMLASARKQKRRENGDPERVITCECNTMTNSDNLLTCELCGNFVHPECYGFLEYPSSNPVWVCYSCMLEGEPLQLEEMKQLCAYRRALYYIHCNGYPARTIDLANHLNITEKKTRDLARILWRKGYLKEARHARRKGFSQTGLPYYQYIGDESKLRAGYFDPTLKVTHYFESVEGGAADLMQPILDPENVPLHDVQEIQNQSNTSKDACLHTPTSVRTVDFSSTQGTPSPIPSGYSQAGTFTPTQGGSSHEAESSRYSSILRKRQVQHIENCYTAEKREKRIKHSSANSPWMTHSWSSSN